jgi:hypothetical protein
MGRRRKPQKSHSAPSRSDLDQGMADYLIEVRKTLLDPDIPLVFRMGMKAEINLQSDDGTHSRELFRMLVHRSSLDPRSATYQLLVRRSTVLLRLDLGGPTHRNPDDLIVPCPHLHRYRPGFGDRWASKPEEADFPNLSNPYTSLKEFMFFCNVTRLPIIERDEGLSQ